MKKALRIIGVVSGIISLVSFLLLGFIYFEDFASNFKKVKSNIIKRFIESRSLIDD